MIRCRTYEPEYLVAKANVEAALAMLRTCPPPPSAAVTDKHSRVSGQYSDKASGECCRFAEWQRKESANAPKLPVQTNRLNPRQHTAFRPPR